MLKPTAREVQDVWDLLLAACCRLSAYNGNLADLGQIHYVHG